METEVWPNCRRCAAARRAAGAGERAPEREVAAQARRLPRLSRPAYGALRAGWAQTEDGRRRLAQAGATVQGVFGNLKFDASPTPRSWRRAALACAARAPGGDVRQFARGRGEPIPAGASRHRDVQWLLVPRHPQRFDEVAALVGAGRLSRRAAQRLGPRRRRRRVWIGDSLGEMALYYALRDVALLGGSFAPLGGQNLIEAAACGCPIVMGPHTFNFARRRSSPGARAPRLGCDMDEGVRRCGGTGARPVARQAAVEAGERFAAVHTGSAAASHAKAVLAMLRHRWHPGLEGCHCGLTAIHRCLIRRRMDPGSSPG
jgi:3-deoxy-D-manno-octulosonic-acid transferase